MSLFRKSYTYVNNALDHKSCIDYIVVSSPSSVIDFGVLDPDVILTTSHSQLH